MSSGPASAASLAYSLKRKLEQSGAAHVRELSGLAQRVAEFAAIGVDSSLARDLDAFQEAVETLDFQLLYRQGPVARASRKARDAHAVFIEQTHAMESGAARIWEEAQTLTAEWEAGEAAGRRLLVEFLLEAQALQKLTVDAEPVTRAMRQELRIRRDEAPSEQDLAAYTERTQAIQSMVRQLQQVSDAAQESHRLAREITIGRAALAQLLLHELKWRTAECERLVEALLAAADDATSSPNPNRVDAALQAHRDLRVWATQANASCIRLQHQEHTAARALAELRQSAEAMQKAGAPPARR